MPEYEVCVDTNNIKYVCLFSEAVFVHTIFIIKYWPILLLDYYLFIPVFKQRPWGLFG